MNRWLLPRQQQWGGISWVTADATHVAGSPSPRLAGVTRATTCHCRCGPSACKGVIDTVGVAGLSLLCGVPSCWGGLCQLAMERGWILAEF